MYLIFLAPPLLRPPSSSSPTTSTYILSTPSFADTIRGCSVHTKSDIHKQQQQQRKKDCIYFTKESRCHPFTRCTKGGDDHWSSCAGVGSPCLATRRGTTSYLHGSYPFAAVGKISHNNNNQSRPPRVDHRPP